MNMRIPKPVEAKPDFKVPKKFAPLRLSYYRWLALFLACMLLFGDAYSFDNPQPLQTNIEQDLDINHTSFNLLYSCYSFPNMILPLFGGFVIDFLGVRVAIFLFATLLIVGQLIVAYGGFAKVFWLMLLGRIIFGIGSESLTVSQTSIVSMWFKNQELAFALSLNFSIPKLGSSLNSLITPRLYNIGNGLTLPLLIGAGICVISWFSGIFLCCMDRRNEKQEGKISKLSMMKKVKKLKKLRLSMAKSQQAIEDQIKIQMAPVGLESPLLKNSHKYHSEALIHETLSRDSDFECQSPLSSEGLNTGGINLIKSETSDNFDEKFAMPEVISLKDIKNLKASFWILMTICMLTEGLFVPFLDNANKFYQNRFGYDPVSAGNILIIPYVLSSFLSPLFGYFVDKIGKRGKFIIVATFLFFVTHVLFTVLPNSDNEDYFSIIPLIFLGICFSLYSSVIMPSLPLVVDAKIIGTALGLVGICQNSALAIFPLIVGAIFDHYSMKETDQNWAYYFSSLFFAMISFVVCCIAILLEFWDNKTGKILDKVYLNEKDDQNEENKEPVPTQIENSNKTQKKSIFNMKSSF